MDQLIKYSVSPGPEAISFLVNNGIYFVFRKGNQSQKRRVFFIATPEAAQALQQLTGWHVSEETGGWDFTRWEAITK